ncbi:MAG: hypothetical protein JXB10_15410 [Pirellulales bacterium]|nr:hypothetical protein [Pirellulales bacterium]
MPPISDSSAESVYQIYKLAAPTGLPDLALNLDHYLYGFPKVADGAE